MRLLCGALRADSGEVTLAGHDLRRHLEQARAAIGYLPQRFSLYGELTVRENLQFFAEVRGLPLAEWEPRSREVLDFVGLAEFADRRAEALSGGMRQKLGLAAAMVHRPLILLLDEPTGGVDPVTRQSFWQLLIHLLRQGVAVLLSTPYMDEASRCGRVGFMNRGKLLAEGSPAELTRAMHDRVIEVSGGPRRVVEAAARRHSAVEDAQSFGEHVHLHVARRISWRSDGLAGQRTAGSWHPTAKPAHDHGQLGGCLHRSAARTKGCLTAGELVVIRITGAKLRWSRLCTRCEAT